VPSVPIDAGLGRLKPSPESFFVAFTPASNIDGRAGPVFSYLSSGEEQDPFAC
jgi:hypothetical protein